MAVVVVEGEDFGAGGIDVVNGEAVGRPDDAVGVGDGAEGFLEGEIGIEAVEFGVAGFFDEADGSGEEAAVG